MANTMTKKDLLAQLAALTAERDALQAKNVVKETNGISVIKTTKGRTIDVVVEEAIDSKSFLTYGCIWEAIGDGERFYGPRHCKEVVNFIKATGIDHLVVNANGEYGRSAPLALHHEKLQALGYTKMPGFKTTNKRVVKETSVKNDELVKLLISLISK